MIAWAHVSFPAKTVFNLSNSAQVVTGCESLLVTSSPVLASKTAILHLCYSELRGSTHSSRAQKSEFLPITEALNQRGSNSYLPNDWVRDMGRVESKVALSLQTELTKSRLWTCIPSGPQFTIPWMQFMNYRGCSRRSYVGGIPSVNSKSESCSEKR